MIWSTVALEMRRNIIEFQLHKTLLFFSLKTQVEHQQKKWKRRKEESNKKKKTFPLEKYIAICNFSTLCGEEISKNEKFFQRKLHLFVSLNNSVVGNFIYIPSSHFSSSSPPQPHSSNRTSSTKKETSFFNLKNQFSLPSATTSAKQDDKSGKKELELSSEVRLEQHKKFINKLHENRVCRSLCDHRFSSPMSRTCWECEKF